jgi:hypothetical protein
VEDDDEMIDRWANLLAASASGGNVPPSYVQTLATLSPIEARLLDLLSKRQSFVNANEDRAMMTEPLRGEAKLPMADFRRATLSLSQQGLVRRVPLQPAFENAVVTSAPIFQADYIGTTAFADDFLAVCSPKQAG